MMTNEKPLSNQSNLRFLLVTANTGTVFEKPDLITAWVNEFADLVRRHPADFIALHCQEVGGKDYERFMYILDPFIKNILQIPEIETDFIRYRLYFDSDYTSQDTFTALGSAYFIRNRIPIQQWNFTTSSFQNVVNRQIFTGNLINAQTLRKEKFPREFFSETKWSRKGFTQARWSIDGFVFDMVNVHLFHDASNLLAIEQSPSIYSNFRKNALQHTLRSLPLDPSETSTPFAIFGDFNFRLDAHRLLQYIAEERHGSIDRVKKADSDEVSRILLQNEENNTKLIIEKKEFNLHDDHDKFFLTNAQQFQKFDFELTPFTDQLFEYQRTFPPSYPYSEELDGARSYLRVRCPAWCDRVFLSHSFKKLLRTETDQPAYNLIGEDICMGDHKPVYLSLAVDLSQGSSADSLPLASVSSSPPSSLSFPSQYEEQTALSNLTPCNLTNLPSNKSNNQSQSFPPVERENLSSIVLNEVQLPSNDTQLFDIHDYATFVQPSILPQWWYIKLHQRPVKTLHSSSKLWAKVRAVTYLTTLAHRTGSWYSDDQTEVSPEDDTSLSDADEEAIVPNIELDDSNTKPDLAIPLRRSFSSITYTKTPETSPSTLTRSRSTTLLNSPDHLPDSPLTDLPSTPKPASPPLSSPSSSPQTSSRIKDNVHRVQNVKFDKCTNQFSATELTKTTTDQQFQTSILPSKIQPDPSYEDLNNEKVTCIPKNNNDHQHRTVLAHHVFHANIKRTLTRWIRETPV